MIPALFLALVLLISPASAQTRYDADQGWIRQTIHDKRRADWLAERRERRHTHYRHYRRDRHYEPRRQAKRDDGTRVYGMTIRRLDTTGGVACYPPVEAYSTEANSETGAWTDAQRNWENQVRAMVGERWMEVKNSREVVKQCWASSGNQSVAGRVMERVGTAMQSVTGNEAGVDGRKHRCRIVARPCQAPVEKNPEVKGEAK